LLFSGSVLAEDFVRVGAGSYATRPPEGTKQPQAIIYRTGAERGGPLPPMPSNDWWSSLAWMRYSERHYAHPLAMKCEAGGLRIYYPGPSIRADKSAIFASMPPEGTNDLLIGLSTVAVFPEARVQDFSDWFVTAAFGEEARGLKVSYGHGSPFVFVRLAGGNPTVSFQAQPVVWSGATNENALGITVNQRHYGLFAPSGSSWSDFRSTRWTADIKGQGYFTVALLPDATPETLALFRRHAHNHVTDTRVAWSYDEATAAVRATFAFTTTNYEGNTAGTLFALYPHQWTHTPTRLLERGYDSVRGPMKLGAGQSFVTELKFPGVLPALPPGGNWDKTILDGWLDEAAHARLGGGGDTYWLGKHLGKWAALLPLAEQTGNSAASEALRSNVRTNLERFLTAHDSAGALKRKGLFYHDTHWGTLIGYPASYGSDTDLNDHHFHYGYFIRAAAELARRDRAWAGDAQYGGMIKLLIRDIASADRGDPLFPFLRNFDPFAGHSWASGHAKFGDGNNNESSSEAMNAWYGLILWGAATGDRAIRDLGVWLYTTEMEAINDYWFDVQGQFHHRDYTPSVVTMVWGGKGANGTWFSANPEMVHGINWLPLHGGSLYLGRYPDYVRKNYDALVAENRVEHWKVWPDTIWMYLALSDPKEALRQFESRTNSFAVEGGNTRANLYHWLHTLDVYGHVDRTVTADGPFYAVFQTATRRTHVAYNFDSHPHLVRFSDGVNVTCQPGAFAVQP
jgi:endoglucanase Acf2